MQRFPERGGAQQGARARRSTTSRSAAKNLRSAHRAARRRSASRSDEDRVLRQRVNKPLPTKLKQKLDANDAALEAQRSLVQNQQTEVVRINELYDVELARLRKLWGGAQPGSLGPVPTQAARRRRRRRGGVAPK